MGKSQNILRKLAAERNKASDHAYHLLLWHYLESRGKKQP